MTGVEETTSRSARFCRMDGPFGRMNARNTLKSTHRLHVWIHEWRVRSSECDVGHPESLLFLRSAHVFLLLDTLSDRIDLCDRCVVRSVLFLGYYRRRSCVYGSGTWGVLQLRGLSHHATPHSWKCGNVGNQFIFRHPTP
jgi:hypothetical protein